MENDVHEGKSLVKFTTTSPEYIGNELDNKIISLNTEASLIENISIKFNQETSSEFPTSDTLGDTGTEFNDEIETSNGPENKGRQSNKMFCT